MVTEDREGHPAQVLVHMGCLWNEWVNLGLEQRADRDRKLILGDIREPRLTQGSTPCSFL